MSNIADLRREYIRAGLDENEVHEDPLRHFEKWFREAVDADVLEPNAMTLSTVTEDGWPDARIVLLKGVEEGLFRFFTNYRSAKGRQLEACPRAALLFHWAPLERQVRVKGPVYPLTAEESDAYFQSRPRGSQIGAWASAQSEVLASRSVLEEAVARYEALYPQGAEIPRPPHWGGYGLAPSAIEFWQGRPNRLHDRIRCVQEGGQWRRERLSA